MSECAISPTTAIARCAANALREELETYPKPGLVSFRDRGSHPDMDADCFLDSIAAIEPFFALMAEAGSEDCKLEALQQIGMAAESAMSAATGGRNTHRGAIFCLGLLCAAAGQGGRPGESLGAVVRRTWGGEIVPPEHLSGDSHGLSVCRIYGIGGVRAEARGGFPSIFEIGLPAFRAAAPHGREAARVQAFFALLATCEDTTLLKRGGLSGQRYAQMAARQFLRHGGVAISDWHSHAERIHHSFVRHDLTAGGAADLLAATLFVENVEDVL
jgi:triphosphoribosyl-dephospho-CoA synthase